MTHDPPATEVDAKTTLYCPACAYNLTGLIENRCPECGQRFDPEQLRLIAAQARRDGSKAPPKPISTGAAIAWLGVHLVAVWLLLALVVMGMEIEMVTALVTFPALFCVSTMTAINTTQKMVSRLAMARAIRAGDASSWMIRYRTMQAWPTVILLTLLFIQWIVPTCFLCLLMFYG